MFFEVLTSEKEEIYHEIMSSRVTVFARFANMSEGVKIINTICNISKVN